MSKYPEHDKLREIQPLSQAIGEFIEWCCEYGRDIHLSRFVGDRLKVVNTPIVELLAQHFGIDLDAIETEKRTMLDEIRKEGRA